MMESELILAVFDSSTPENSEDNSILDTLANMSAVAIINKTDSTRKMSEEFEQKIKNTVPRVVYLSAKSGEGLDTLAKNLNEMFALDEINLSNDALIANARQLSSVNVALDKICESRELLSVGESADIVCFALEGALSSLEEIDARGISEQIVNQIFSRFCVGK